MPKFPGFKRCMKMMRKSDPQIQEDGFHLLAGHASNYIDELIAEFQVETNHGLKCWIVELIGYSKNPAAFTFLSEQARSSDEGFQRMAILGLRDLNTRECRTLLYELGAGKAP